MNLKEKIQYGKTVKVTNGKDVIDANVCRINTTCFILTANGATLTFSFTGRLNKKSVENFGNWTIVEEDNSNDLFARFEKGQTVNYLGHQATITKVSEEPNTNGWYTYSVRYFAEGLRHGQSQVEEHEIKAK